MRHGGLSSLFDGVAVKRLAAVDACSASSNQHEVTGSEPLLRILGQADRKRARGGPDGRFEASYIWLGEEGESLSQEGHLSWYDSRRNKPRKAEWRLYYQSNAVTDLMSPGDSLFLARRSDDRLVFIVTPPGSTGESQLLWLFGLSPQISLAFESRTFSASDDDEIGFAARFILDELGIDAEEPENTRLDELLEPLGRAFPTAHEFSALARSSVVDADPLGEPDAALVTWMEQEERLFRRLERHLVEERLSAGFRDATNPDVDGFLSFSLSVQQRRRSRVGHALENHLTALFEAHGLSFDRNAETENRNRPDFLFPSRTAYLDPVFPPDLLTLLGAKSTLRDRWRQVLSEGDRVPVKHLISLEPGISENQTSEMRARQVQLVLPRSLHTTFRESQRPWLMNLGEFLRLVGDRQRRFTL